MGTINYRTSDYITMGIYPQSLWDFKDDKSAIIDEMLMNGYWVTDDDITEQDYEEYVYQRIADYEEDDYYMAKDVLADYIFRYFTVEIEAGYYQGFSINIEYERDGYGFNDMEEKNDARREVGKIRECLTRLADIGLFACYPSWGTTYEDYYGTIIKINEACGKMLEDVRTENVYGFSWEV